MIVLRSNSRQLDTSLSLDDAFFDYTYDPMDLDLLSVENYYEGTFDGAESLAPQYESSELLGALLAPNRPRTRKSTKQKNSPANGRTRHSPSKEILKKNMSPDEEHGARHRGRPRLDTRDETAAEV